MFSLIFRPKVCNLIVGTPQITDIKFKGQIFPAYDEPDLSEEFDIPVNECLLHLRNTTAPSESNWPQIGRDVNLPPIGVMSATGVNKHHTPVSIIISKNNDFIFSHPAFYHIVNNLKAVEFDIGFGNGEKDMLEDYYKKSKFLPTDLFTVIYYQISLTSGID